MVLEGSKGVPATRYLADVLFGLPLATYEDVTLVYAVVSYTFAVPVPMPCCSCRLRVALSILLKLQEPEGWCSSGFSAKE